MNQSKTDTFPGNVPIDRSHGKKKVQSKGYQILKWGAFGSGLLLTLGFGREVYKSFNTNDMENYDKKRGQIIEAIPERPKPNPIANENVSEGYVDEIGTPTVEGLEIKNGAIYPDFRVNDDYGNLGDINNFILALAELNKNREADRYKEEIMLPEAEPVWGAPLRTLKNYKIKDIRHALESDIPKELLDDGFKESDFYEVSLGVETNYSKAIRWLLVAKKGGRFYLVKGI